MSVDTGRKNDAGKDRWTLLPIPALRQIVKVLTHGAQKYTVTNEDGSIASDGAENWRKVPNGHERYTRALFEHVMAWREGEIYDSETGLHHLAHAGCNILFLLTLDAAPIKAIDTMLEGLAGQDTPITRFPDLTGDPCPIYPKFCEFRAGHTGPCTSVNPVAAPNPTIHTNACAFRNPKHLGDCRIGHIPSKSVHTAGCKLDRDHKGCCGG